MGFFRQPEQRLLSDYYFSCPDGGPEGWTDIMCGNKQVFFRGHQACATKMLTSTDAVEGHCASLPEPTEADVALAETYVLQSFAFIGITEEWDLSMCLFNAKFGTPCNEKQFVYDSGHQNGSNMTTWYELGVLDGFVDKYDNVLYDRALEIFAHELSFSYSRPWRRVVSYNGEKIKSLRHLQDLWTASCERVTASSLDDGAEGNVSIDDKGSDGNSNPSSPTFVRLELENDDDIVFEVESAMKAQKEVMATHAITKAYNIVPPNPKYVTR